LFDWAPYAPEVKKSLDLTGKPVKFKWSIGDKVVISVMDCDERVEHLVLWDSSVPYQHIISKGLGLPGLSFTVFEAAMHWWPGIDRPDYLYAFKLVPQSNGYELLQVPSLLRDATLRSYLPWR